MKLMIASDIHGSALYCEKMLERYKAEQPDKLILLGDILYHGPRNDLPDGYRPKKVISMLNEIKHDILCVRGNCDCEVDQMVLEFPILADYRLLYRYDRMIYITHGHVHNLSNMPMIGEKDILLHGHTHVPSLQTGDKCIYLNPGSVSIPKENSPHSYMIMDDEGIHLKDLDGNEYDSLPTDKLK